MLKLTGCTELSVGGPDKIQGMENLFTLDLFDLTGTTIGYDEQVALIKQMNNKLKVFSRFGVARADD